MSPSRQVLEVIIDYSALLGLVFIVVLGRPWRSKAPPMAWLQAAIAWATLGVDVMLWLALHHIPLPPWVPVVWLGVQDAVFTWRVWELLRIRARSRS